MQQVVGIAGVVGQRFQRQPFQPRPGLQLEVGALRGRFATGFVKAGRSGGGDQRMGMGAYLHRNVQCVTADQTAGRVHQHVVAHGIALGVEAAQHAQGPIVAEMHARAPCTEGVVEIKLSKPGHAL